MGSVISNTIEEVAMEEEMNRVRNIPPNTLLLDLSSPHTPGCLLLSHAKNARKGELSLNELILWL